MKDRFMIIKKVELDTKEGKPVIVIKTEDGRTFSYSGERRQFSQLRGNLCREEADKVIDISLKKIKKMKEKEGFLRLISLLKENKEEMISSALLKSG